MPTSQKKKTTPVSKTTATKRSGTYLYAVGKRKTSIAQVRLYEKGKGEITINGKKVEEYFFSPLIEKALQPLKVLGVATQYDVEVKVIGGGISSQADAVSHGVARGLSQIDDASRTTLKRAGLLTRDARTKERKKFGLKKARRAPQWSKR